MSLSAERAASFRRRGIAPLPSDVEHATVALDEIAAALRLTRRAVLHHALRGRLRAVRRTTLRNWRWEVEPDEAARFIAAHRAGEIGNAANRGARGRTWTR